jgi:predicted nucleotide-binding protein (sugar kinase/HSP70/actin superfamily)
MRRVTFPYMGTSHLVITWLFREMGTEVVPPLRPSQRTLSLGVRYSPEFACLPYKILTGTYIEALEQGANTLVTSGGVGPCRAGLYAAVHEKILKDLGYEFDMIVFEPPSRGMGDIMEKVQILNADRLSWKPLLNLVWRAWEKIKAMDTLEKLSHYIRPREEERGTTTRVYNKTLDWVDKAQTLKEIREARDEGIVALKEVPHNPDKEVLRVAIVGEIYVVMEPAANLEIEEILGEQGVEVERSIFLTGWTRDNAIVDAFRITGGKSIKRAASEYLPEMIGGHGQDSIGHTILYAKEGYDGVIQLAPFTCIPEIVAMGILPKVSRDYNIPVLSIALDEQTGKAGLTTRVEAFVDLLRRRRRGLEAGIS